MPEKPPAEECGRCEPFMKEPAARCEEPGRTEPWPCRAPPEDTEPWCVEANALRCCSGRERPEPSWRVTTRMPGFGGLTTGACVIASEAAVLSAYKSSAIGGRRTNSALMCGCRGLGTGLALLFLIACDGRCGGRPGKGTQGAQMGLLELCICQLWKHPLCLWALLLLVSFHDIIPDRSRRLRY